MFLFQFLSGLPLFILSFQFSIFSAPSEYKFFVYFQAFLVFLFMENIDIEEERICRMILLLQMFLIWRVESTSIVTFLVILVSCLFYQRNSHIERMETISRIFLSNTRRIFSIYPGRAKFQWFFAAWNLIFFASELEGVPRRERVAVKISSQRIPFVLLVHNKGNSWKFHGTRYGRHFSFQRHLTTSSEKYRSLGRRLGNWAFTR